MSVWVVDSSVAAKWFFPELHSEESATLLDLAHDLHAPDFFLVELDNLFCTRVRRDELDPAGARRNRQILRQLPIQIHAMDSLLDPAFEIALQTGRSLYDCFYVALAAILQERMVTADRSLYHALQGGPFSAHVLWVGQIRAIDV